jgi:hypothetical protein
VLRFFTSLHASEKPTSPRIEHARTELDACGVAVPVGVAFELVYQLIYELLNTAIHIVKAASATHTPEATPRALSSAIKPTGPSHVERSEKCQHNDTARRLKR